MTKSPAFVPAGAPTLVNTRLVVPVLVSVTVIGVADMPTGWLPKFTVPGFSETAGPVASGETVKRYEAIAPMSGLLPPLEVVILDVASCPSVA
jgi:hypothetical protein